MSAAGNINILTKALCIALFLGASVTCANAWTGGIESRGPNCAVTRETPEWRAVWLGHFAGGQLYHAMNGERSLDWQDRYFCFPSRASCQRWQREMRAAYRKVEGYRACLLIRNGPLNNVAPRYAPTDGDTMLREAS